MGGFGQALIGGIGQSDLANSILKGQQFAINAEEMQRRQRADAIAEQKRQEAEKQANTFIPWDTIEKEIPYPSVRDAMKTIATNNGYMVNVGGIPGIKAKDKAAVGQHYLADQSLQDAVHQGALKDALTMRNQLQQQVDELNATKPNDKMLPVLQQKLADANKGYQAIFNEIATSQEATPKAMLERNKQRMDEYYKYHTPESVDAYFAGGEKDPTLLKKRNRVTATMIGKYTPESLAAWEASGNDSDLKLIPNDPVSRLQAGKAAAQASGATEAQLKVFDDALAKLTNTRDPSPTAERYIADAVDEMVKQKKIPDTAAARFEASNKLRAEQQGTTAQSKKEAEAKAGAKDPRVVTLGDKIGRGEMVDLKQLGAMKNIKADLVAYVADKYPNIDIVKMSKNIDFMGDPVLNRAVSQVNAVLPRLEKLKSSFATLQNGQFKDMNALKNWILSKTGDPAVVDVLTNRNSVVLEALRAMTGSQGASDYKGQIEMNNLDYNYSPEQMAKAFDNIEGALQSIKEARNLLPYPDWAGAPAGGGGSAAPKILSIQKVN